MQDQPAASLTLGASTHLADEGEGLPPHPLGTVAEPDGELVDEVQAQVVGAGRVELLKDLHHLRARGGGECSGIRCRSALDFFLADSLCVIDAKRVN